MLESKFILILLVTPFILGIVVGILRKEKSSEGVTAQIFGWMFYFGFFSIIFGALVFHIDANKSSVEYTHYLYIHSLKNKSEVSGDFFLGSGSIENKEYYYFYYKSSLGFKRDKVLVSETSIVETDDKNPEIVRGEQCYDQNTLIKWQCGEVESQRYKYIMYVPKGTIIKEFNVY